MSRSNTFKHAERELDILVKTSPDPNNRPIIEEFIPELLALVDKFGKSGQSGGSAPYTAGALSQAVKTLCLQKPLCPITGIDDEWMDVANLGDGDKNVVYQNNRCYALFKNSEEQPYYLDAIVWKDEKDFCYTGRALDSKGNTLLSRQFIKGFPFEPKTFYIDVISKEVAKDDWEFTIKDEKQLDEVFEYYKRPN